MNFLSGCNPLTAFLYFTSAVIMPMITKDPVIALISLTGAFVCSFLPQSGVKKRSFYVFTFILLTLLNPLVSHNGKTVLFLIEDTPITLESLIYGAVSSAAIVSVIIFLSMFSSVMKSDRLLYLFGILSPKVALILSTTIRFIPLFLRRAREIEDSARVMGIYKDGNLIDTVKGKLHVFSVMTTWMLEDGINTADSMTARGYGISKRTSYTPFKFTKRDLIYTVFTLLLIIPPLTAFFAGYLSFEFYPSFSPPEKSNTAFSLSAYICTALLSVLPLFYDIYEELKWKYLMSKI